jgi:hypothetical protein
MACAQSQFYLGVVFFVLGLMPSVFAVRAAARAGRPNALEAA